MKKIIITLDTISDYFGLENIFPGNSFLNDI